MSTRENFTVTKRYSTISIALMVLGLIAIIALYISTHGGSYKNEEEKLHADARFWASLLQNSVYFLLVVNASMFFICATTLAWGGWQMAFRRVPEAIAACVPAVGVICGAILLAILFSDNHTIYHWADPHHVEIDPALQEKSPFLNKGFFAVWTVLTIVLWSVLGWKMRKLSTNIDNNPLTTVEAKRKYVWNNTVWAAVYIVVFALTVMSTIPWFWLMSIDSHWYSTMYSWYTFGSTFVAGMALIGLYVVFLKNNNYLETTNVEHLHDIGKFVFAFSIFWTYLWFAQFMLIWYANIPEETIYFKGRAQGEYRGVFWLMLIINFIAPFLVLMSRDSKRNYTTMTFVCILVLFGHWLNFFQMVMPGVSPDHQPNMLYDMGVGLGFVGVIMFVTGRTLSKYPLEGKNHPFAKESVIHHT